MAIEFRARRETFSDNSALASSISCFNKRFVSLVKRRTKPSVDVEPSSDIGVAATVGASIINFFSRQDFAYARNFFTHFTALVSHLVTTNTRTLPLLFNFALCPRV